MTGSNTNSNVVFGSLQQSVAALIGASPLIILAAQTAGSAIGSAFAPAKIIVGCSTVGSGGEEGPVLRTVMRYGLIIIGRPGPGDRRGCLQVFVIRLRLIGFIALYNLTRLH